MDDIDEDVFQLENVDRLFDIEVDEEDVMTIGRIPKRYLRDYQNPFEHWREHEFLHRYRFSEDVVMHYILPLIRDALDIANSNRGLPVSPEIQLAIALRYYATNSFQVVSYTCQQMEIVHGCSQSTVCLIVRRVSVALAGLFNQIVQLPSREEQILNAQLFYNCGGMRSIYALIDGVLIRIASPGKAIAEIFRCRKSYFVLNVLAIIDGEGSFRYLDVRHPGSVHDQTAVDRSALKLLFETGLVDGIILGDPGYACTRYLFTPIPNPVNEAKESFNESLIATRSFIERIFGRWKRKFPCIQLGLSTKLDTSMATICTTAVLWNIYVHLNYPNQYDLEGFQIEPEAFAEPPRPGMDGFEYRREYAMRYFS
ncbi:hypothetical protein QAD02_001327 [Eretmocerus hayati]|uniref:Uncharacterized protein n=1 Tax=Eretmocerus hayati TaxID=131215 RepID=A0ACC2NGY5_9HYME|nr:hypothetical protein QAD02_001327 [Eretmocerus hayati]